MLRLSGFLVCIRSLHATQGSYGLCNFSCCGEGNLKAGSDASDTGLFGINEIPELAFDHKKIIENARSDINGILSEMQKHDDARKEGL